MGTGDVSDREAITATLDRFEAAQAEVAALGFDALTAPEVLNVIPEGAGLCQQVVDQ